MFHDMRREDASFADLNNQRIAAMELYQRCLDEDSATPLQTFLEAHLSVQPPPIDLLRELADDLHQHLQRIRQSHFGCREELLEIMLDDEAIARIPNFDPMRVPEAVLMALVGGHLLHNPTRRRMLRRRARAILRTAARLTLQLDLTWGLYQWVMDWANALEVVVARSAWSETYFDLPHPYAVHLPYLRVH